MKGNLEDVFAEEAYDIDKAAEYMHSFDAGLNEMIASRRRFFGPNVLELCEAADVVFLALHGANGEDGKVQATFDLLGIPYTGTGYLSSALAMDKSITKQFFRAHHVPTPNGVTLKKGQESEPLSGFGLELPVVVKPCCGGSSVGVYIAHTNEEYWQAMKDAFSYEPEVVVEEYIEGREFSVGVVDGKAYPIIEIAPVQGFYDYKNKYKAGSAVETCPAELSEAVTEKMQHYAEQVAQVLGLDTYSRTDFLLDENENIYCLFSFSLLTRCRLSNICFSCVAALSPERATDGAEICLPIVSAAATSLTSAKNECCITLPNESTTATAAAALNNGMKRAVNVMRLAFTTGASISASTRASKSAPRCSSC